MQTSRLGLFARGVKVLDVSSFLPGPLASLLLADMGAEVLKIEQPSGDPMIELGPRGADGQPVFHQAVNAGKSVRRMDLKDQASHAEFLGLVAGSDVLIEGFRPGVMERLGLGYETLRAINPGLIFCSLSGYGAEGDLAQAAGHDANYLATAGVLHRNGRHAPEFYDPPLADVSGSLFGVIAILGAPMPLQLFALAELGANGTVPQRRETYLNGGAAYYQVYATRDGRHVAVGAIEAKFWSALSCAAGHPDWIARQSETLPQTALIDAVAAYFATLTLDECLRIFAHPDCCVSPVLDLGEAVRSPHHAERRLVRRGPDGALQTLFPAWIDGQPPASRPALVSASSKPNRQEAENA